LPRFSVFFRCLLVRVLEEQRRRAQSLDRVLVHSHARESQRRSRKVKNGRAQTEGSERFSRRISFFVALRKL
jgi:hypothetical protein